MVFGERELKDTQEEYWRAYQLSKQIWEESGDDSLRRKFARPPFIVSIGFIVAVLGGFKN
jgi:hypothetical protein